MIIVPTIVLIGLLLAAWIIYQIGYSAGYYDGRHKTLDQVAEHAERERRYNVDRESTRRLKTWSKTVREVK